MKGWATVSLADVATLNPTRPRELLKLDDSHQVTFVPMTAVNQYKGEIESAQIRPFGKVKKGFTYFAERDVIFAKITPCMQNGKSAIASGLVNGLGFGSTEFHVIRPNTDRILPEWIWYFVRQAWFRNEGIRHFRGAVGQQRVPVDYLGTANIPLPPVTEQSRIVARITECIERVDEIDKLRALSDAESKILLRSFYRDLYCDLKAKHDPIALSTVGRVTGGGTPSKQNAAYWSGEIPWVSPKDMKRRDIDSAADNISDIALHESSAKLIETPSVLFVVRGMILAHTLPIAISRVPLAINQDMKALTPTSDFGVEYIAAMLRGAEPDLLHSVEVAGHGTRRLQTEHWQALPIPALSKTKQREVVSMVCEVEATVDMLRDSCPSKEVRQLREAVLRKAFAGEL